MSIIKLDDCEHAIHASNANLANSQFEDVRLADSTIEQVTFESSTFKDVYFDQCRFDRVSFAGVQITNGVYNGMSIDGIDVNELLAVHRRSVIAA